MPSRRDILRGGALLITGMASGCGMVTGDTAYVDIRLLNNDTSEWPFAVTILDEDDGEVFQTEEVVQADDGEDMGEVYFEKAFEGTEGDLFVVQVELDGKAAGEFEYEITCTDESQGASFDLVVTHNADPSEENPVEFAPRVYH